MYTVDMMVSLKYVIHVLVVSLQLEENYTFFIYYVFVSFLFLMDDDNV